MANVMKEFHTKNLDGMNVARFFGKEIRSLGLDIDLEQN